MAQLYPIMLEQLHQEYDNLMKLINELQEILDNPEKCKEVMKNDLIEVKEKYGDDPDVSRCGFAQRCRCIGGSVLSAR